MTHEFGKKIDLILSRLAAVDSKLELIDLAVKGLEEKLGNVQGRVQKLEEDQSTSKQTIKEMQDGLQHLI